jgi:SAM-dependent methyltransferase
VEGEPKQAGWHARCLLCGTGALRGLARYRHAHLVRCGACRIVFAARIPTEAELDAHYADYGHAWFDSPITRKRYDELLRSFEHLRRTNRLLDFGCGEGFFLEQARDHGWQVCGTEYGRRAIELARQKELQIVPAPQVSETLEPASFDVVTAFEVFEHVRDPLAEGAVVAQLLRPGGLLYCTTPNFDSLSRRLLGPRWNLIEYPEHLFYFTAGTLQEWLARHGLLAESVTSAGISLARLRAAGIASGGEPEAAGPETGPAGEDEALREAIDRSRVLGMSKTLTNLGLGALGLGDTLKGRFRLSAQPIRAARR